MGVGESAANVLSVHVCDMHVFSPRCERGWQADAVDITLGGKKNQSQKI